MLSIKKSLPTTKPHDASIRLIGAHWCFGRCAMFDSHYLQRTAKDDAYYKLARTSIILGLILKRGLGSRRLIGPVAGVEPPIKLR